MRCVLCLLPLGLAALPALACPTAEDLATGIRLTQADGSVETFRRVSPAVVEQRTRYTDGYEALNLFGQGLHLMQLADLEEDGTISNILRFAYGVEAAEMPVPTAGGSWQVEVGVIEGFSTSREVQSQSYGAATEVTIGDCTYDAIPVTIDYLGDETDYSEEITYLPSLGFGYLTRWEEPGTAPDTYVHVKIEAVAP